MGIAFRGEVSSEKDRPIRVIPGDHIAGQFSVSTEILESALQDNPEVENGLNDFKRHLQMQLRGHFLSNSDEFSEIGFDLLGV